MGELTEIKRSEAEGALTGALTETDSGKDLAFRDAEAHAVEIKGRQEFFGLRRRWSTAIMWWISVLIFFNAALTVAVGLGGLSFAATPWFVTAVTVETFLQVIGLGYVAVKFLFSKG